MRDSLARTHSRSFSSPAGDIERAAVRAVAYGDVFDYALDLETVHRYLHGIEATPDETARALRAATRRAGAISRRHGYYTLAGREDLVELRRQRTAHAAYLWPRAVVWGRRIARLPFVRMVAITGALAWNNVEPGDDIDYLIVTKPGRVWLARALIAALGRLARLHGVELCANYVLATSALVLPDRSVYTAYELAHMIPIAGRAMYRRMRRLNQWTDAYFPNARGAPDGSGESEPVGRPRGLATRVVRKGVRLLERNLDSSLGETVERWEMSRCIRKRAGRARVPGEAVYSRDFYKDHLEGHRHLTLSAFAERLGGLGLDR